MQQPRKYLVNEVVKLSTQQTVNAQGKAREDVLHTLTDMGFQTYNITNHKYTWKKGNRPHHYPFFSEWFAGRQGKKFVKNVQAGDVILIQEFYLNYMQHIATESLHRGATVIFLVHDVQCIRFNKQTSEISKLNNASLLLVHTDAMKQKLEELGVTTPMRVIQLFDYYSDDSMSAIADVAGRKNEVIFAGNLSKSAFLPELIASVQKQHLHFLLYGLLGDIVIPHGGNTAYKGAFRPTKTGGVLGGWGLVWDGDSIDACAGLMGNYLRYNSSHKVSLYLTCGLPLIVWEHSSLATWVKERHIGITVSGLTHLDSQIDAISDEEYQQMIHNAREVGMQLREGYYLRQALR